MLTVPGDMEQPDRTLNQMAPIGTPEGQPAPRQLPEVEGDESIRYQSDLRLNPGPVMSFDPNEPEEGPKEPIPGADQGVEGEMEESEDIAPWESEEERQAMVDSQLKEYRATQEFQKLADNGGGGDSKSFLRHRVKIGNTTGEIVRTNSRGVFIKIPDGPTRFMSWGGLSKRIESGDFKPNKARLNQQLKGE